MEEETKADLVRRSSALTRDIQHLERLIGEKRVSIWFRLNQACIAFAKEFSR